MQTYPSTAFSHMQARRCILAMMKHQPSQTFVPFQRRCPVLLLGEKQQTHPQSRRRPVHLCTPRRHAQERRGERRRPTSAPESPPAISPAGCRSLRPDRGVFAQPLPLFSPVLRARIISGGEYQDVRARPVVGLSLARVPAIRPVRLHQPGGAAAPSTATVPTTTSGSSRPPDRRLDRSCQETIPSPHHSAADSRTGRARASSQRARCMHCKQLLVSWAGQLLATRAVRAGAAVTVRTG
jgi:hypothetical protein